MRILQVNSAAALGGAETHVLQLTAALKRRGHDVVIAGRARGPLNADVHFPFLNSVDIYSVRQLHRFLKSNRFDVVHAHVARDYPIVASALRRIDAKLVLTRHLLYPIRRLPLYRRVDGWIAPTAQILETIARFQPKVSAVIPNWVNVNTYAFRPHRVHVPIHLGVLGQISPHKGHDDAIAALRILGGEYRLLIAGEGKNSYVNALKDHGRDLPIDFLGIVNAVDFFARIDILLVPSWEEPFGIVALEAMACGIPVVATAAGGPLEIIHTGVDGLLVKPRNPAALAAAIRSLSDEQQRAAIARNARERVEADFDMEKIVPRIEEFYRSV